MPSQCEIVTGPGFSSPNQSDQERTIAYRDSSGPDSRSDAHCATIFGDWEEPSGESWLMRKAAARTKEALWNKVGESLDAFTPDECANYFITAGYEPE